MTRRPFPPYVQREFRESRDVAESFDKGHGRIERRRIVTSTLLNDFLDWPGVGQVYQLTRTVTRRGKTTTEVEYGVGSVPRELANAETINQWRRGHWGIENRVHWVRDMIFGEDASRIRKGSAPQVLAAIRNAVISILRIQNVTNIAATLREHAYKVDRLFAKLGRWNN